MMKAEKTNIFTRSHKGTKKGMLKIFNILFVISVASCEKGLGFGVWRFCAS